MMTAREELSRFFGKLATLVAAGVPLLDAFEKSAAGTRSPTLSAALGRVLDRAYGGSSITDAFSREEGLVAPDVLALVEHGERAGDLEKKAHAIALGLADGVLDAPELPEAEAGDLRALLEGARAEGADAVLLEREGTALRIRIRRAGVWSDEAVPSEAEPERIWADALSRPGSRECVWTGGAEVLIPLAELEPEGLAGAGLGADSVDRVRGWLGNRQGMIVVAGLPGRGRERVLTALLEEVDRGARKVGRVGGGPDLPGVRRFPAGSTLYPDLSHLDVVLLPEARTREEGEAAAGGAGSGMLVLLPVTAETCGSAVERVLAAGFPEIAFWCSLLGGIECETGVAREAEELTERS